MIFWHSFIHSSNCCQSLCWVTDTCTQFSGVCNEILLTLNSLDWLCVCGVHPEMQWESPHLFYSLCPLSCWATARSRWTCRCSSARPTTATCGPTPSTRCTASPARPWPLPARRSSLPAPKCWKFPFFLKIICQPGTSLHESAVWLLCVVFIFFVCAKVKEKSCKISGFSTNLGHDGQTHLLKQSEVREQRGREALIQMCSMTEVVYK